MRIVYFLLLLATLTSCASGLAQITAERQVAAAGFAGCAPDEIAIAEQTQYTWAATCRGVTFQCTVSPAVACAPRR